MMRRWCTTLTPGGARQRRDHDTLSAARARATVLTGRPARMTIWFNDDDGTGWHSHDVIDLAELERVA